GREGAGAAVSDAPCHRHQRPRHQAAVRGLSRRPVPAQHSAREPQRTDRRVGELDEKHGAVSAIFPVSSAAGKPAGWPGPRRRGVVAMITIHRCSRRALVRQWLTFGIVLLMSLAGVGQAFAQSVSSGTIEGTVKDESNSVLPGVTVTVTSTAASVAFTKEVLDSIPRGRDLQNIFAMAPGVTQAIADVGGSTMAQRQNLSSYGVLSQPKLQVEGMNITMGADQNTAIYFNDSTLEEVQIRTSGNDAEVSVPGISMVAIMKSGGNDFHGTYQVSTESPKFQADNLNDALRAQGRTATSPLKNFYDVSADLGGRLVRDKLWFYAAYGRQAKKEGVLGFASGPGADGRYLTADDPLADFETSL